MVEGGNAHTLASLMEEAGYRCCSSEEDIERCLARFGPIKEDAVAQVLAMMARTMTGLESDPLGLQAQTLRRLDIRIDRPPLSTWNTDMFIAVVLAKNAELNWEAVARGFDHPQFNLPDQTAFRNLMTVWAKATPEAFPLNAVVGDPTWPLWHNTRGHVQFLQFAIAERDPSVFTFEHAQRKQPPLEGLKSIGPYSPPSDAWLCLDVIETLCRLAEVGQEPMVSQILDEPLRFHPELLIIGLAAAQPPWGLYLCNLCETLTMQFLLGHINSPVVLPKLWEMKKPLVQSGLVAMFYKDPATLPRVLQICRDDLKALTVILEHSSQADFALALAALASQEDLVSLPAWIADRAAREGPPFLGAVVTFLENVASGGQAAKMHITSTTLETCFRALAQQHSVLNPDFSSRLNQAQLRAKAEPLPDASPSKFPPDVEQVTNDLYQELYQRKVSVDELLQRAQLLHSEGDERQTVILACILQSLLDEYKHLDKYPEAELRLTGEFYGGLIRLGLFESEGLGEAMKKLLACFSASPDNNFWKFGIIALEAFKDNLGQWVKWSSAVLALPNFRECAPPHLVAKLEANTSRSTHPVLPAALDGDANGPNRLEDTPQPSMDPHKSLDSTLPPGFDQKTPRETGTDEGNMSSNVSGTPVGVRNAFQALNTYTLEEASKDVDHPIPPSQVQDKVAFAMNNLSSINLETKVKELKGLITEEYFSWFANYLVVKRAAQEPNFHPLYLVFVDALDLSELRKLLVNTTYKYIRVLLATDRIKTNSGERTLLRNLGSWLGRLTIMKNKPLRARDLDLKEILYEAYEQGKMIAVLPFIGKVLEPGKDNKVYKPPNPWIMGILGLAAEIYAQDKLKLNLKFEIEMMFRNFSLSLEDVQATSTLHEHKRDMVNSADFSEAKPAPSTPEPSRAAPGVLQLSLAEQPLPPPLPITPGVVPGLAPPPSSMGMVPPEQQTQPFVQPPPVMPQPEPPQAMPPSQHFGTVMDNVIINPTFRALAAQYDLTRVVAMAVDAAVTGLIGVVVERAVTISSTTTFEFVTKDFAFDGDEGHVRNCAHVAVSRLASSLAQVTCREPLRSALHAHLRKLLETGPLVGLPPEERERILDNVVPTLLEDNIPLGCKLIDEAATSKAVAIVEIKLHPCYEARARAKVAGEKFVDGEVIQRGHGFAMRLPESLRPKQMPLGNQYIRIYEDFSRVPPVLHGRSAAENAQEDAFVPTQTRFPQWSLALEEALRASPGNLEMVQGGSPVARVVDDVMSYLTEWETGPMFAKQLMARMFEVVNNKLHNHACVLVLGILHKTLITNMPAEVTATFINLPDDSRKWRPWMVECLLRNHLLDPAQLDLHMVKHMETPENGTPTSVLVTEFAAHIIRSCVVKDGFLAPSDLVHTLERLNFFVERYPQQIGHALTPVLEEVKRAQKLRNKPPGERLPLPEGPLPTPPPAQQDTQQVVTAAHEQLDTWLRAIEDRPTDKEQNEYVRQLQQQGWLEADERTGAFFRILGEVGISVALNTPNKMPQVPNYVPLDAYTRLVAVLVKAHRGGPPVLARACLEMSQNLLRRASALGESFGSRPYFRFFIGLINELKPEDANDAVGISLYEAIAAGLLQVQPLAAPGFAFSWLELMSHRHFLPTMLSAPNGRSWDRCHALVMVTMRFLEPYLRVADLSESMKLMYKGTLRVLLVLLHDFPEFLCEYSFDLCNTIPPSCIQLRNLILSAFPCHMRLPDPFTPQLKVDLLPDINATPSIRPDPETLLVPSVKAEINRYLQTGKMGPFLTNIGDKVRDGLVEPQPGGGNLEVVRAISSLVLYIGAKGIAEDEKKKEKGGKPVVQAPGQGPAGQNLCHELFKHILQELSLEGRYIYLNAIVNNLRFPNSYTHYFSCVILWLFSESSNEDVLKEQITRVLLERLIVNRPHPWGLLITFIELIKNKNYRFWENGFVRASPEIARLFEGVAKSCMNGVPPPEELPAQPQAAMVN